MKKIKEVVRMKKVISILVFGVLFFSVFFLFGEVQAAQPANPNANAKTVDILNYLTELPSKSSNKILSGQYVGPMPGFEAEIFPNIYNQSGQYPAIVGTEYFALYDEDRADDFTVVNSMLISHSNNGGLVAIMSNAPNPNTGHFWVNGVPPDRDLTYVDFDDLITEGHSLNTAWKADLDRMATGLAELQAADVTVLFRPLHEMNGYWYWWGNKDPDQFKAAWIYMFNYLTYTKGLNNLLWVYSPNAVSSGSVLTRYPGGEYVDIVGVDKYSGLSSSGLPNYAELVSTGKPVALAEFGTCSSDGTGCDTPDDLLPMLNYIKSGSPDTVFWMHYSWHWAMGNHLNVDDLLNDPWVVNRGEIELDTPSSYCGDGNCDSGETCSSCPQDCPTGAGQVCCSGVIYTGDCCSDTDCTSPNVCVSHVCSEQGPYCGDGTCNNGETCSSCPQDCGTCTHTIPGQIEAEDYKQSGEEVGYHDTTSGNTGGEYRDDDVDIESSTDSGGGYNVGWIDTGEWLAYDVDVESSGLFDITARVASAVTGTKTLHIEVDDVNVTGPISFDDSSGWQSWSDATVSGVGLTPGNHELRIVMDSGSFNINYIAITKSAASCGDGNCDPGETCLADSCCNGLSYNTATQVCCSETIYTGDCCDNNDCTSPDVCINHVCSEPRPTPEICQDLALLIHFDEDSAQDSSDNDNDGTVNGATFTPSGKFSGAFEFDGDNAYVEIPDSSSLDMSNNIITVTAWIYPKDVPSGVLPNDAGRFINRYKSGTNTGFVFDYRSDKIIQSIIFDGTGTKSSYSTSSCDLNTWCFVAFTQNSTTTKLYFNGIKEDEDYVTANLNVDSPIRMGVMMDASYSTSYVEDFNGIIDEVAIWSRALSSDEILNLYNSGGPISCGESLCGDADTDNDGVVATTELMNYISRWKNNEVIIGELMASIGEWKYGC